MIFGITYYIKNYADFKKSWTKYKLKTVQSLYKSNFDHSECTCKLCIYNRLAAYVDIPKLKHNRIKKLGRCKLTINTIDNLTTQLGR